MLGDDEDFATLCDEAKKRGMRLILDGVFSHTGCDSKYFNQQGRYDSVGAYNSRHSEYYSWYKFINWPNTFDSWWGITTLPELREEDPSLLSYLTGDKGIVRKWIAQGAGGWRLDVADELPDIFLDHLRSAAKAEDPNAVIFGEVWEDASNKIAYSYRRRYLLGKQLDSVMNYCFKDAILGFLTGMDASSSMEIVMNVLENYPPQVVRLLMNLIGTHDTERIITMLAGEPSHGQGREWQASHSLSAEQRAWGKARYKLATVMQYTLPGVPSIYYGDETGVEGYRDPFNRACYPWGNEDNELIEWHRMLGKIRTSLDCFVGADFTPIVAQGRFMSYSREGEKDRIIVAVNAGEYDYVLPIDESAGYKALLGEYVGGRYLRVAPGCGAILRADKGVAR
ncbi:MAG: glycoside hydrolase family 13 protein, partial [Clostridia bacterium]|nr:glycoside hydrolase family 13 protein [Clostridia bacterium]